MTQPDFDPNDEFGSSRMLGWVLLVVLVIIVTLMVSCARAVAAPVTCIDSSGREQPAFLELRRDYIRIRMDDDVTGLYPAELNGRTKFGFQMDMGPACNVWIDPEYTACDLMHELRHCAEGRYHPESDMED